jgi:hypothetical protein
VPVNVPTVVVEASPSTDPTAAAAWADVSAFVRSFSSSRGRQSELDRFEAGTLTVVLDNRTGAFDPVPYGGGAAYRPLRQIRVRATWAAVTYPVWAGFVESITPGYEGSDAVVTVTAADAMKVLNLSGYAALAVPAELSGARVARVLAAAAPSLASSLEPGLSTIVAGDVTGSALQHLQDVEETENGQLFIARDGTVTFQQRTHRSVSEATSSGVWADAASAGPVFRYVNLQPSYDDSVIWNDVRITPSGGVEQVASDATSQARYFPRTFQRSLLVGSALEAMDAANYIVGRYSEPDLRYPTLELEPQQVDSGDVSSWPTLLALELSRRITVRRTVQGVRHTSSPGRWQVQLTLSPVGQTGAVWILGSSQLGVGTKLGY